jgi:hypothetical protein
MIWTKKLAMKEKCTLQGRNNFKKYMQNRTDTSSAADNMETQFESLNLQRRKNIVNKLIL